MERLAELRIPSVSDEYEKLHELDFTYFNHTYRRHHEPHDLGHRCHRHALSWVSYQALDCVVMFIGPLAAVHSRLAARARAHATPFIFILTRGLSTRGRCSSPSATRLPK